MGVTDMFNNHCPAVEISGTKEASFFSNRDHYDSELSLVNHVLQLMDPITVNKDVVIKTELRMGYGRPDIILGEGFQWTEYSDSALDILLDQANITILSCLYSRKPVKVSTLCRKVGSEQRLVQKRLNLLMDYGFVESVNGSGYIRCEYVEPSFSSLLTIEAKLFDWKKALIQASRNRLFSTYSYVLLDAKNAGAALKSLEEFRRLDVGLAILSPNSTQAEIVFHPGKTKPISKTYFWLACALLYEEYVPEERLDEI